MTDYRILLFHKAVKHLEKIPKNERKTIGKKIEGLKFSPRPPISIKLVNEELYRMRVGNYRILYTVDDRQKEVNIIAVKHRSEAYKNL